MSRNLKYSLIVLALLLAAAFGWWFWGADDFTTTRGLVENARLRGEAFDPQAVFWGRSLGRFFAWDLPQWWQGVGLVRPALLTLLVSILIFVLPEEIRGVSIERWMVATALGGLAGFAALFGAWGEAAWFATALGGYLWFERHPLKGGWNWPSRAADPTAAPPIEADPNPPAWSAVVLFALGVLLL